MFFTSAAIWAIVAVLVWYSGGSGFGTHFGMAPMAEGQEPPIGLGHFTTPDFIWFYLYFAAFAGSFGLFWQVMAHEQIWRRWSIWGSIFILFITYYSVQVSVALNNWRRPFFDAIQNALTAPGKVTAVELYSLLWIFCQIAFVFTCVIVVTRFFVSHYVFRWRTAMNDYYVAQWPKVRTIEGASQRIQEDTMRFASITEDLGVSLIDAVMTLIAFLPVLYALSSYVDELPIIGAIPAPLFTAAIFWSIFGTALLSVAGIKLPGLNFLNQRVEASYRKELVYGEDDINRAQPLTVKELFSHVRRNYFRMYFHYLYFNVVRYFYIQADNIFSYLILIPTIVAGKITFGILQQILTAFGQVSSSFQFLVNSWTTIIELMSIHKRLASFEAAIKDQPLVQLDQEYVQSGGKEA
jgi:peptide/bleomycin uptake transporter